MPEFTLHRPPAIGEAVKLQTETHGALYVAGGTDMIVNVRRGIEQPAALVDLSAVSELQKIVEDKEGLHIGSGVPLETISRDARILKDFTAVAEAAATAVEAARAAV